jgi:hypothetical protein
MAPYSVEGASSAFSPAKSPCLASWGIQAIIAPFRMPHAFHQSGPEAARTPALAGGAGIIERLPAWMVGHPGGLFRGPLRSRPCGTGCAALSIPDARVGNGRMPCRHPCRHGTRRSVAWRQVAALPPGWFLLAFTPNGLWGGKCGKSALSGVACGEITIGSPLPPAGESPPLLPSSPPRGGEEAGGGAGRPPGCRPPPPLPAAWPTYIGRQIEYADTRIPAYLAMRCPALSSPDHGRITYGPRRIPALLFRRQPDSSMTVRLRRSDASLADG